jgi:RNA polymerase sigma-70 factor, ECF subfamily
LAIQFLRASVVEPARWSDQRDPGLRIARLYQHLTDMTGSPVIELNRAVAVAMADGPAAGLALLQRLEAGGALAGYYLLSATRADFLRRTGWKEPPC